MLAAGAMVAASTVTSSAVAAAPVEQGESAKSRSAQASAEAQNAQAPPTTDDAVGSSDDAAPADHLPFRYTRIGSWGDLSRTHTNTCGGDGNPNYSVNWQPNGDKLFIRDCDADGYGARAQIYYSNADSDVGNYSGLTATDRSSKGDGGWKAKNIRETNYVMIRAWSYRGDDRNDEKGMWCGPDPKPWCIVGGW